MAPRGLSCCHICKLQSSKYSCPSCLVPYCSVTCFKDHKSTSCCNTGSATQHHEARRAVSPDSSIPEQQAEEALPDPKPLRPLTSLKWPYMPEESSFPDPLKRDEPKALQLYHYQAIATSPEVRSALSSNPSLQTLLRRLDELRGSERENALETLLGVASLPSAGPGTKVSPDLIESEEDRKAFKHLAEAVEKAVRGKNHGVLGLDWNEDG